MFTVPLTGEQDSGSAVQASVSVPVLGGGEREGVSVRDREKVQHFSSNPSPNTFLSVLGGPICRWLAANPEHRHFISIYFALNLILY